MSKPNLPIPPSYADEEEEAEQLVTTEEEDEETEPFKDLPEDSEEEEWQKDLEEDEEDEEDEEEEESEVNELEEVEMEDVDEEVDVETGMEEEQEDSVVDNSLLAVALEQSRPSHKSSFNTIAKSSINSLFNPSEDEWQVWKSPQDFTEMGDAPPEEEEEVSAVSDEPIDIREVTLTPIEAFEFAEYVLQVLEEDLAEYIDKTGITFDKVLTPEELKRKKLGLKDDESVSSFKSVWSDVLPGDPSRVRLTYEKGTTVLCTDLGDIPEDRKSNKEVQVNLHRPKKQPPADKYNRYVQTLEMTFLTAENAFIVFKNMYPHGEEFKAPPPSIPVPEASKDVAIKLGDETDSNVETIRKVSGVLLANIKQPFVEHYYKEEKFPDGARFKGEFRNMRFFKARYENAAGTVFEGEWQDGEYQSGQITFGDGLKFEESNWKYCDPPDRRFNVEKHYGLKPAGLTLFSNQFPQPKIPPGTYDCGDGYFNPKTNEVRGYERGNLLRTASPSEKVWIENCCRKFHESLEHIAPKFLAERVPGSYVESQKRIPITRKYYH